MQLSRISTTGGLIVSALLMACSSLVSAQGAYKCVDTQGNVTYTELALAGADCTPIGKTAKSSTDPEAAMQKLRDQVEAVEQADAAEDKTGDNATLRKQNCDLARKNQDVLAGPGDVVTTDADGNKSIMGEEARSAALQLAKKDVDYCCDS
jgi:hypothetical protein